jgi:hypothetical protein
MRQQAADLQRYAEGLLATGDTADDMISALKSHSPRVYDGRAATDGVAWDAVLVATGSDGGGLSFEQVSLRACVRFVGTSGRTNGVTWHSIDCPHEADDKQRFGPYDETIRLKR